MTENRCILDASAVIHFFKKNPLIILLVLFISCTSKPKTTSANVSFTNNKRSIKFSGLDPAVIGEITRDSIPNIWGALMPIYIMPVDTNLKNYQPIQHGRYLAHENVVVFTPDTPFADGKTYFLRLYRFGDMNDVASFIRQKNRLGSVPYNDLIFK